MLLAKLWSRHLHCTCFLLRVTCKLSVQVQVCAPLHLPWRAAPGKSFGVTRPPSLDGIIILWHGCISSNVETVHIMLAQRGVWTFVCLNINRVKAQDIQLEDCPWSLFMPKNMTELWMLMLAKNRFRTGVERRGKH